jgi:hypothetical protein
VIPEEPGLFQLPEDRELLAAMVRTLLWERNHEKQRAEELEQRAEAQAQRAQEQKQRAEAQEHRAEELQVELLRLQLELERFKKWYYGPRADRLQSSEELSQLLLNFAEQLDRKPIHPDDVPPQGEQEQPLRRVKRRKGRRHLANFENLPVTTRVYELSAPAAASRAMRSVPMRAGRWSTFLAASSASITCARSMPALVVSAMGTIRGWK